ncbi:MAG: hypothetical protein H7210_02170 [Pyrinomonadaceae bacterium]|nr:hypothetical protein [Phycisphaerales bacterium]
MKPDLNNKHQHTYDAIMRHPTSHNLQWREVRSLLESLGEVVEGSNGHVNVTRNGKTLVLHSDHQKDVGSEKQIKSLRTFIEGSNDPATPEAASGVHLLVVVDHREARIYKTELRGSEPQRIAAFDPENKVGRHVHHVDNDSTGLRRPEVKGFYDAVGKALKGAEEILIFGSGTGGGSAMESLLSQFKLHHKDVAAKVVGSVVVDESHMTEDQLLAKAREFYLASAAGRGDPV